MSSSKRREMENPRQQSGMMEARSFMTAFAVMACVWFGMQQYMAGKNALPHATTVVHAAATTMDEHGRTSATAESGFGRWGVLARPMLVLLSWIHEHVVSNWGWAIVILTGMINLALWPTRVMSLRSTLKMQRIQPQMEAIRSRYKDCSLTDPRRQEMQREVMELQKSEGASAFGGCLPMLITWPLMVGFYRMLAGTVALRGAPWLWLHDLAAPDPLHMLPLLVMATIAATQLLTPMPGVDTKQQRVMAVGMAGVFGMFAWKYAAGLALYFVCSNVFGLLQQLVIHSTGTGREIREIAARRAVRAG